MNTPINAGKEHNPWDRKPHEYGAPEWRLLNTDEAVQIGDEYNCKDYRCEPRWAAVEHTGYMPISHTEYRRRTTPPTQSQEGETPETDAEWFGEQINEDGNPKENWRSVAFEMRDHSMRLESRLTAAQREIDRLVGEVAGLREDKRLLDHLDSSLNQLAIFGNFVMGGEKQSARAAIRRHIENCRAATEEGK